MKTSIVLLFTLFGFIASAQLSTLTKANGLYNKYAYFEAAKIYQELIGSSMDDAELKLKLADCYYQMGDTESAEKYYEKAVHSDDMSSIDVYQYAQSLKENKKYDLSDKYMDKFIAMNDFDARGELFESSPSYLENIRSIEPFFQIENVNFNSSAADFGGYFLNNKVYFVSNRKHSVMIKREHTWTGGDFLDLYHVNTDGSDIERMNRKVNSKFHEGPLCQVSGTSRVFFTRNNVSKGNERRDEEGIQNLKLFTALLSDDGNLSDEFELDINSKEYSVGHPSVAKDGKTIYFVSDMPGGYGGADIYIGTISEDGNITDISNLGDKINTEGQEMFPWVDANNNLFFASDGHVGLGGLDVFVAKVLSSGGTSTIQNLGEPINSNRDDFAFALDPSTNIGYVSSNRDGGNGGDDIYSVKKLRDLDFGVILNGVITDVETGEVLTEALVRLLDENGNIITSTVTDKEGNYTFSVDKDKDYSVKAEKVGYSKSVENISTKAIMPDVYEIKKDLDLRKSSEFGLYALVTNARTGAPIEGVEMTIINNVTGEKVDYTTPVTGDYAADLYDVAINDPLNYSITLSKEGYVPKTVDFNTVITRPGVYSVQAALDMDMVAIGEDGLLVINPIYFDLDKFFLRDESKIELDRIVKIMNDHPSLRIELGSHTDCRQTRSYNQRLSQRRAETSAKYIKQSISNPSRITYKGYGESRLLNDCECEPTNESECSEDEHQMNRRTEFRVLNPGSLNIKNNSPQSFDK